MQVLTSQQAAEIRGSKLSQGAKGTVNVSEFTIFYDEAPYLYLFVAMVVRVKGEFSLIVLSAAYKLDMKAVKVNKPSLNRGRKLLSHDTKEV